MNTRHAHDTHSHTTSPLRAPSRKVLTLTPEEAPLSSEFCGDAFNFGVEEHFGLISSCTSTDCELV